MLIGNAPAVTVTFDGEVVPIEGEEGQVRRIKLPSS
ncbi:MAG: DUF4115 domain-containing protein [Deltaproteobacteria bacterium]|nr:DUF4115 domain-containing protein [Deltaproteobacteria bacterium]